MNQCREQLNVIVYGMQRKRGGGIEEVVMNYLRFKKSPINYVFAVSGNKDSEYAAEIEDLGANIEYITPKEISVKQNIKDFVSILKKYDKKSVIYFNAGALFYALPYYAAFLTGYRNIVVHAHNGKNVNRSALEKIIHYLNRMLVNCIVKERVTCSDYATDWIFGKKYRICALKINNAVNINRFCYNSEHRRLFREKYGLQNQLIIGNVGRISAQKNQIFALKIFKEIRKKIPESVFIIVGSISDNAIYEQLKIYINNNELNNYVYFLDVTDKIENIYSGIDIMIFPSLYEGFGLVCLEAQIAGVTIYLPKETVPPEVEISPVLRWMSLKDSPEVWAEYICEEQLNNKNRCSFDRNAREHGFEITDIINQIEKIFYEVGK